MTLKSLLQPGEPFAHNNAALAYVNAVVALPAGDERRKVAVPEIYAWLEKQAGGAALTEVMDVAAGKIVPGTIAIKVSRQMARIFTIGQLISLDLNDSRANGGLQALVDETLMPAWTAALKTGIQSLGIQTMSRWEIAGLKRPGLGDVENARKL